ncbi:MAG: adenylosuccinate lyase, partial [Oscillospiraceae bacterium]
RQDLHEKLRVHSQAAAMQVKQFGLENDLCERIANDPEFGLKKEEILSLLDPTAFTGRAPKQVSEFINDIVKPILSEYSETLGVKADLKV